MALTYGFYDSLNGDRKYNASQMSKLFKGIISDGVFSTVGGGLLVSVNSGMNLNVATGRCWFNNTWTDVDATYLVTVAASEAVLNRIDIVVVEINSDTTVRANSIKVIKGTPASSPIPPTLQHTTTLNQYPLAYISVLAGVTSITADKITNKVGTVDCPFATGAVPTFDPTSILNSWQSQFDTWFNNLVDQLSGTQVTNLQNEIDQLTAIVAKRDNYQILTSISSDSLVVALKNAAGNDPDGSDPCRFKIGNTIYTLSSAMQYTIAPGTNKLNLGAIEFAAMPHDVFLYAIVETGAAAGLKFGHSRIPWAKTMGDFSSTAINEKGIVGNFTNINAGDLVKNIGRFRIVCSNSANGYKWSIPMINSIINEPHFETDWMDWNPQCSASSSLVWGSNVINLAKYKVSVKRLYWEASVQGTFSGVASNHLYLTAPFQAARRANSIACGAGFAGAVTGTIWITGATPVDKITCDRYDASNYPTSGNLTIDASGYFEI